MTTTVVSSPHPPKKSGRSGDLRGHPAQSALHQRRKPPQRLTQDASAAFAADEGRFERDVRADRLTGRSFFGGCGEETTVVVIDS